MPGKPPATRVSQLIAAGQGIRTRPCRGLAHRPTTRCTRA